jgi:hypothetical protein
MGDAYDVDILHLYFTFFIYSIKLGCYVHPHLDIYVWCNIDRMLNYWNTPIYDKIRPD